MPLFPAHSHYILPILLMARHLSEAHLQTEQFSTTELHQMLLRVLFLLAERMQSKIKMPIFCFWPTRKNGILILVPSKSIMQTLFLVNMASMFQEHPQSADGYIIPMQMTHGIPLILFSLAIDYMKTTFWLSVKSKQIFLATFFLEFSSLRNLQIRLLLQRH